MDRAWQIALIPPLAGEVPESERQVPFVINAPPKGHRFSFHFLGGRGIALTLIGEGKVVEHYRQTHIGPIPAEDGLRLLHEADGFRIIGLTDHLGPHEQSPAFVFPIPGCGINVPRLAAAGNRP